MDVSTREVEDGVKICRSISEVFQNVDQIKNSSYNNAEMRDAEVRYQGWPSGLGSELIIRLRRVQLLHPGFVSSKLSCFLALLKNGMNSPSSPTLLPREKGDGTLVSSPGGEG